MNMKKYFYDDNENDRVREFKTKATEAKDKTIEFVKDHKEIFIAAIPFVLSFGKAAYKANKKSKALKAEKNLKDLYCYDRSMGHYWKLKRSLTNREWLEVSKRRKKGEAVADILESMRVLK